MTDMRETLRVLRGLQELDEDLYRVKDELRRLPEERERRRAKIDDVIQRGTELEQRLHETRSRIKEIEDMTTMQRQRLRKLENEIADTADQALIAAFQHEMRTIRRDIGEAEEEGLTLVEACEAIEKEKAELETGVAGLEEEYKAYSGNVDSELASAEERFQGLDTERKRRIGEDVSPAVLEQYEKLLDSRQGQAMAMLDGRVCQGCFVSVPNNIYVRLARAQELVSCPSCGRILYLPDNA